MLIIMEILIDQVSSIKCTLFLFQFLLDQLFDFFPEHKHI